MFLCCRRPFPEEYCDNKMLSVCHCGIASKYHPTHLPLNTQSSWEKEICGLTVVFFQNQIQYVQVEGSSVSVFFAATLAGPRAA